MTDAVQLQLNAILEQFGLLARTRQNLKGSLQEFEKTKRTSTLLAFANDLDAYCKFTQIDKMVKLYTKSLKEAGDIKKAEDTRFYHEYKNWQEIYAKLTDKLPGHVKTAQSGLNTFEKVDAFGKLFANHAPHFAQELATEALAANLLVKQLPVLRAA